MPPKDQFESTPDYGKIESRAERRAKLSKTPKKRKIKKGFGELLALSKTAAE